MSDEPKHLVIAPRAAALAAVPNNWQDEITSIDGVSVIGSNFGRLQVRATPKALETARGKLGHVLLFEEVLPRSIPE